MTRIERNVLFYEALTNSRDHFVPDRGFDDVLAAVEDLDQEAVWSVGGEEYAGRVYRGVGLDLLVVSRIIDTDHPHRRKAGEERELGLAPDEKLSFRTPVAFFPGNVVALLGGGGGASATRIRGYINAMVRPRPRLAFQQLIAADALDRLADAGEFVAARFRAKPDVNLNNLSSRVGGLKQVFLETQNQFQGMRATLQIQADADDRGLPSAERLLSEALAVAEENLFAFDLAQLDFIRESTGERDEVNFLTERLTMRQPVVLDDQARAVTDDSAVLALQTAYNLQLERIRAALDRGLAT